MSQQNFRKLFLERILGFLWDQWASLGISGESTSKKSWLMDPEPLLCFSLKLSRFDARLFDEIIDWLVVNGRLLDIQRLRGILRTQDVDVVRLVGAVSAYLSCTGFERKWKNISELCRKKIAYDNNELESLFFTKDGKSHPVPKNTDPNFKKFGFNRPKINIRKNSQPVTVSPQKNLRFLLRSLFGIGSRSECIAYLLTHESGHPSEIAQSVKISVRGVQDSLIELARSGLVMTRVRGKRKIEYLVSDNRWWRFLSEDGGEGIQKPAWIDWISLYSALSHIWTALNELQNQTISQYMKSSKLRDVLEQTCRDFSKSGLDIPQVPGRDIGPEKYENMFEAYIIKILSALEENRVAYRFHQQ
jgi:hypothetical protein